MTSEGLATTANGPRRRIDKERDFPLLLEKSCDQTWFSTLKGY